MLILGVEDPDGQDHLSRRRHAERVGQDEPGHGRLAAARLSRVDGGRRHRVDPRGRDGQLRAINPERGFFGVAPNTSAKTNPNAMAMVRSNTIFTNVATTPAGEPWWEGIDPPPPAGLTRLAGQAWTPGGGPAAHPNSRFTVLAAAVPVDRAQLGGSGGRADLGLHLRLAARARGPARLRGVRLGRTASSSARPWAPRRPRRSPGRSASCAAIPMAMLPVLRLQHGRLLRATGSGWARGSKTAAARSSA